MQANAGDCLGFRSASKRNLKIIIGGLGITNRKMVAGFFKTGDFSRFVTPLSTV